MSENKWMAGPWHHIDNSWEMSTVYDQHERVIAEVPIDGMCDEHTQIVYEPIKDANALLIAAAPDLHEALQGCIEHMEHSTPQGKAAYEAARSALAKARGES